MKEKEWLLQQYYSLMLDYVKYKNYIENKIENLLIENNIKYQNLTSRIKEVKSLSNKLENPEVISKLRGNIKNLNDLCGVRIILYDNNNLNRMISIIEENFEISDYKNKKIDYNANNITIKIKDGIYSDFKCEIQLVTVMSHNLIEIGHDIVYKDNNKLSEMDNNEYTSIVEEYKDCLEEVYKLETRIENIKTRANNIFDRYRLYEIIISASYIDEMEKNKSLSKFYNMCNEIESLIPFLSRNSDKAEIFLDKKIIVKLTNSINNLNDDGIYTKEFVFDNYVRLLSPYSNVWIYDLNDVFKVLIPYLSSEKNSRMNKCFFEMIKNIITYDIKERKWIIFDKIKEWIVSDNSYPIYRVKIANCISNSNISYSEEIEPLKMNVVTKGLEYNEEGKKIIVELFDFCCNLFLNNQNKYIYDELINLSLKFSFLANEILVFFNNHYESINDIYKFDVVRRIYYSYKDEIKENEYYNRINKEQIYNIYKYLVYDYFDEEFERKDWRKIQAKGCRIINDYIKNVNKKEYEEIVRLFNCYESLVDDNNCNLIKFEKFLVAIGSRYDYSKKIYSISKNAFLYLGMCKGNLQIKKRYDYDILNAIKHVFVKRIFLDILKNRKNNKLKDAVICSIILDDNNGLYKVKSIKNNFFEIVKHYNKQKKFIVDSFISCDFVENISSDECSIILENYRYHYDNYFINYDINIMNIFKVYPQKVRLYISKLIKSKNKNSIKHPLKMYISSCDNYEVERKNNVLFILELLKKYEYIDIYKYVDDLIEKNDKNIVKDLISIILCDFSKETLLAMAKLLCELELGVSAWDIDKMILIRSNDEVIEKKIFNSLIDFGVVHSFAETYENRIKEFKKIKKKEKNERLDKFLGKLIRYYQNNYDVERLRELNYKNKLEIDFNAKKR